MDFCFDPTVDPSRLWSARNVSKESLQIGRSQASRRDTGILQSVLLAPSLGDDFDPISVLQRRKKIKQRKTTRALTQFTSTKLFQVRLMSWTLLTSFETSFQRSKRTKCKTTPSMMHVWNGASKDFKIFGCWKRQSGKWISAYFTPAFISVVVPAIFLFLAEHVCQPCSSWIPRRWSPANDRMQKLLANIAWKSFLLSVQDDSTCAK